jgi:tetratricopeptide (TPR) repeat protein
MDLIKSLASSRKIGISIGSIVFAALSLLWAFAIGLRDTERINLALVTLTCSVGVGSLIGFVLTIFGDEVEALGKARDSLIALVSGIAGIGVAKTAELGGLLGRIQLFPQQDETSSWFSVLFVTTYTISGFYAMYFFRKLFINPALAAAHARLELTTKLSNRASQILTEIEKKLPKGILLGRDAIDDIDAQDSDSKTLKEALLSKEVDEFLSICEDEVAKGSLTIDLVYKASVLHYYRIRTLPAGSSTRMDEAEVAKEWLTRATMIDPLDPGPQLKLAEVYGMLDEDETCISILEKLEWNEESPQYLEQWLGFYLLFSDGREKDAIRHSEEFLKRYPTNEICFFNIARAYSQILKRETETSEVGQRAEYRNRALTNLRKSVKIDSELKAFAKEKAKPGESFDVLANDPEFLEITAEGQEDSTTNANPTSA